MKVLMFGWEFPPNNRGGLGAACYGLTKGLAHHGVDITLILPKGKSSHPHLKIIATDNLAEVNINLKYVDSLLGGYLTNEEYLSWKKLMGDSAPGGELYGRNLFEEVERYAKKAGLIAQYEDFDVIHCHDWMTYKAGMAAKEVSGKPLVVHVHATDFDRTGGNPNQYVYDIERTGMHAADKVITVSGYTRNMVMLHYGVHASKVQVVHNAVEHKSYPHMPRTTNDPTVLFLGRLTLQKGPEYFVEAAKKVLDYIPNARFIMAGSGEKYPELVNHAVSLGMAKNMLFTGHLKGDDVHRAYQMADVFVMPSVSEPFGLTALEAMQNGTPIIISKQSGVSEVLTNALKVDFWDVDEIANKMVSCLAYRTMQQHISHQVKHEVTRFTWEDAAAKCVQIYNQIGVGK